MSLLSVGAYLLYDWYRGKQSKYEELSDEVGLLAAENQKLLSDVQSYNAFLSSWQNDYDSQIGTQKLNYQNDLLNRKQSLANINAELASQNREGTTARLIAQQQQNQIKKYYGEDMNLNADDIESAVADAFNTDINKLSLIGQNYTGLYEKQLISSMSELRQTRLKAQESLNNALSTIESNEALIKSDYREMNNMPSWITSRR